MTQYFPIFCVSKNMKKMFLLAVLLLPVTLRAYDFQLVVSTGQTLYFDTVPGGVKVVYPHAGSFASAWEGYSKPTGDLSIPSAVVWQGMTRQVLEVAPGAFYDCNGITSLSLDHGIATLGNSAFRGCSGLTSVFIPASVTSIGSQTFGLCTALTDVWIYAPQPPATSAAAFYNVSLMGCVLHVPCQNAEDYSAETPWMSFGSIVAMPCMSTVSTAVNNASRGSVTGAGSYPYGTVVTLTAQPVDGYAFICWNDGDTLNPRSLVATADTFLKAMFFPLVHDTIDLTPVFYRLQVMSDNSSLGLGVGSATLPDGTLAEVCALPLEGGRFVGWSDGVTANPRQVTVTGDITLTAFFNRLEVSSTTYPQWSVAVEGRRLVVAAPEGRTVSVYDAGGRVVVSATITVSPLSLSLPAAGVYVVSVDGKGARKVTVE